MIARVVHRAGAGNDALAGRLELGCYLCPQLAAVAADLCHLERGVDIVLDRLEPGVDSLLRRLLGLGR